MTLSTIPMTSLYSMYDISTISLQTLSEAMKAREAGIKIIVVAVSDWVNENEVMEMASDPDDNSVFRVPNFNEIRSIEDGITEVICNGTVKYNNRIKYHITN